MIRYVDAETLKAKIHREGVKGIYFSDDARENDVCDMIDDSPTADVVEVVRCIECKYEATCERKMVLIPRQNGIGMLGANFNATCYCSYGERSHND